MEHFCQRKTRLILSGARQGVVEGFGPNLSGTDSTRWEAGTAGRNETDHYV